MAKQKRKRNIIPTALLEAANYVAASSIVDKGKRYLSKKKKGKNPSELKSAERLSSKWHGRGVKKETEVTEIESYADVVAELADLEELGVITPSLEQFTIRFKTNRPKVCATNEDNLEFVGGDQKLSLDKVGVERNGKCLVPLGYLYCIVYETDKHHLEGSNGYPESYEHFFCEEIYKDIVDQDSYSNSDDWFEAMVADGVVQDCMEDGKLPMLVYNKTDKKLVVVGGIYTIEDVGIRN